MIKIYGKRRHIKAVLFVTSILLFSFSPLAAQNLDYANRLNQQAIELGQQRRYKEAIPYAEQALEIRKKVLGEENRYTAGSYHNLGWLYYLLGNYREAEPLYLKALEIKKKVIGEEFSDTAVTYHDLAVLYRALGNYAKAEPLYLKALEIRKKVLGEEHPDTARSYYDLRGLYMRLGNYA